MLTNKHANTTIPEVHGAARAWEVTGDRRWREIVEAYWQSAVLDHGYYCTGGQTDGEVWTPPYELSARLGDKNQEHCVVYNMMRLADWLLRWTGDVAYADYWERNLYNGILAQQHPDTGMIAYFLPFHGGGVKAWGTPTQDFWCCHGTLLEAHASHNRGVYFEDDAGLVVSQFIASDVTWERSGVPVRVTQTIDPHTEQIRRPQSMTVRLTVTCERPVDFTLTLRLPWWVQGDAAIEVNGARQAHQGAASSWYRVRRTWHDDALTITLPKGLTSVTLPDDQTMVAFMDGPVVLAGLDDGAQALRGDAGNPATLLTPDNEREWNEWKPGYRTRNQPRTIRFTPLYEVRDEPYSIYFPVEGTV